jgi:hypothetical protein
MQVRADAETPDSLFGAIVHHLDAGAITFSGNIIVSTGQIRSQSQVLEHEFGHAGGEAWTGLSHSSAQILDIGSIQWRSARIASTTYLHIFINPCHENVHGSRDSFGAHRRRM